MLSEDKIFTSKKPIASRYFVVLKHYSKLFTLTCFAWISTISSADNTTIESLSFRAAIQRSTNHHPELRAYADRMNSQQGYLTQAGVASPPEIDLTVEDALGSGEFNGMDNAQTTLSISWVLDSRIVGRRVDAVASRQSILEIEREIKQLDIAAQTARYFLTALAHQERQKIAKQAQSLSAQALEEIKKRVEVGKSPIADQLRAEVNLARRTLQIEDLTHEVDSSKRQLAAQWGDKTPKFGRLAGTLAQKISVIDPTSLEKSLRNNPDLKIFLTRERAAQTDIALAKAEASKRWRISTGVRRYEATDDYAVVAGISVPLGDSSRNKGRIAALTAEQSRYQSEADALNIKLQTQLFVLYQQLLHSIHVSEALSNDIIPRLERAVRETEKAYQLGKYSYLEWSAVQQELFEAQSDQLDAYFTAHINTVEIERLTGLTLTRLGEEKE
tara:strand:- start:4775 stop:6106 length:1332 start_codon:yes stop_codon:yes gene_type:complete